MGVIDGAHRAMADLQEAGWLPAWPLWSIAYLAAMAAILAVTVLLQAAAARVRGAGAGGKDDAAATSAGSAGARGFRFFQFAYLSVYLTVMLADWMQGTNMYTLYESYGVDTAALFLTGFLSSAVFGTVLGLFVDSWGRKLSCAIFCVLEIVINALEHVPSMPLLLLGRVLGGLSSSLLFSSFESWMVAEHRKRGFPEGLLKSTFGIASSGNGIMAIAAGLSAQVACDAFGEIGPFKAAIALTVLSLLLILALWPENRSARGGAGGSGAWVTLRRSFSESFQLLRKDRAVLFVGLAQALFEGAMYTFVFMWVPTLLRLSPTRLPTGVVFSAFMTAVTFGGVLFGALQSVSAEVLSVALFLVSAAAMATCALFPQFHVTMVAFLVFEACVGVSFAAGGVLRSKYIPESHMAGIMNLFRVPLNALVVTGTKLADLAEPRTVFAVCSAWHLAAAASLLVVMRAARAAAARRKAD